MIDVEGNVNLQNVYGATALMFATRFIDTAKALIEAGADVNLQSKKNNTALSFVKREGHTDIINLLRAAGATE